MGDKLWPTFQKILNVTWYRLHIVPLVRSSIYSRQTLFGTDRNRISANVCICTWILTATLCSDER